MAKIQTFSEHSNTLDALSQIRSVGLWQTRASPVFEKYFAALCLGLIGIASARITSTYDALSLTVDEPSHLACGMEYLANRLLKKASEHAIANAIKNSSSPKANKKRDSMSPRTSK
jgi:hypothetical protein